MSLSTIRNFEKALREMPRVAAQKAAALAAPALTDAMRATFDEGADAYGVGWRPGAEGQRVTLKETGALANRVRYTAIGTKIRMLLAVPYAKYQVGRRPIAPRPGDPLPPSYVQALKSAVAKIFREGLSR